MRKDKGKEGAPAWVQTAAALVGIGTLLWAIASHFLPSRTEVKPDAKEGGSAQAGPGGVAVDVMNGGTINNSSGLTATGAGTGGAPR